MEFTELNNNEIPVKKVKMKADFELATDFCDCMSTFFSGYLLVVAGYSGSGKTNLLINLMSNKKHNKKRTSFKGCFHNIFIVSPSLHTLEDNIFKDLPEGNKFTEFNVDMLKAYDDMIAEEKEVMEKRKHKGKPFKPYLNLLLLDDIGSSIRSSKKLEESFNKLIANRRHSNTSIIMLLQNVVQIGPKIRSNMSHFISFKPKSIEEEERIYAFTKKPKKHMKEFFDYFYQKPHDFLYIDMSLKKSNDFIFYHNFNRVNID